MFKVARKPVLILAACASAAAGVGAYAWLESKRPPILEEYVFDEPGAPAMLVRTPEDARVLVDGGSNADVIRRLTSVLPFYSRHIDMVVATAPDAAHVTGLIDVLERYDVGKAVIPSVDLASAGLS